MATRPPAVDDWQDVEDWRDTEESPKFSNPAGNAWNPSSSRAPFDPKPSSMREKIQQQASGFAGGLASEIPNVGRRFLDLGSDIYQGWKDIGKEKMGIGQDPASVSRSIKDAEAKYKTRRQFEEESAPAPNENIGATVGRFGAKALPQLAVGAATGGTSLPFQAAAGGGTALLQGLSEGATPGEAGFQAALGAAAPAAGKVVSSVGNRLKKAAVEQYFKALNPTRMGAKATTARIVPELLERGVTGDLESLAASGAAKSGRTGKALETAYGQSGKTVNATQIADDLERLKAPFLVRPGQGNAAGPMPLVHANPGALAAIENVQASLRELGDTVAPDQLWKFRQNIDDIVNASGGFQRDFPRGKMTAIAKQARAAIQKELTASVPDVARLNAEYSLWQGLEDVAKATIARKTGQQGAKTLLSKAAGGMVGAVAASPGGPVAAAGGAMIGQGVAGQLTNFMTSPAWRTVSAVQKHELARLLTSGKPEAAARYLARLGASSAASAQNR